MKKRSPGQTAISLSIEETLLEQIDKRAESLGLSRSSYLAQLARQDLVERGPLVLQEIGSQAPATPSSPASVQQLTKGIVDKAISARKKRTAR